MKLLLLTPSGTKTIDNVAQVTLPTSAGEITVLPGHEPVISELASGAIEVHGDGNKVEHFAIFEGFAKISQKEVKIYSAGFEEAENLNEAKIQEAIERAKGRKADAKADVEFAAAAAMLERELAKLKTLKRRHRYQG